MTLHQFIELLQGLEQKHGPDIEIVSLPDDELPEDNGTEFDAPTVGEPYTNKHDGVRRLYVS